MRNSNNVFLDAILDGITNIWGGMLLFWFICGFYIMYCFCLFALLSTNTNPWALFDGVFMSLFIILFTPIAFSFYSICTLSCFGFILAGVFLALVFGFALRPEKRFRIGIALTILISFWVFYAMTYENSTSTLQAISYFVLSLGLPAGIFAVQQYYHRRSLQQLNEQADEMERQNLHNNSVS